MTTSSHMEVWLSFGIGLVGFPSAFFLTINGEMDKSRLVLAGLAMTVIGAVAVSFGVTHNVVFSVAFGGGFGLILALAVRTGVRAGLRRPFV